MLKVIKEKEEDSMGDYVRTDTVNAGRVNSFLENGWEVIETTKSQYDESTELTYHVGLPSRVLMNQLIGIIKEYEKHGLKEKLFENVAKEFGEDMQEYGSSGYRTSDKTPMYMERYEKVVNNVNKTFYKDRTSDEPSLSDDFEF